MILSTSRSFITNLAITTGQPITNHHLTDKQIKMMLPR